MSSVQLLVRVHVEADAGWVTEAAVASVEVAAVSVVAARRTSIRCPATLSTSCGRVDTYMRVKVHWRHFHFEQSTFRTWG